MLPNADHCRRGSCACSTSAGDDEAEPLRDQIIERQMRFLAGDIRSDIVGFLEKMRAAMTIRVAAWDPCKLRTAVAVTPEESNNDVAFPYYLFAIGPAISVKLLPKEGCVYNDEAKGCEKTQAGVRHRVSLGPIGKT